PTEDGDAGVLSAARVPRCAVACGPERQRRVLLLRWRQPAGEHGQELGPGVSEGLPDGQTAIKNGHPHRFRDTFAVSLLVKGVSIEVVSKLLGHGSIKVTERHYALGQGAAGPARGRSPPNLEGRSRAGLMHAY